jgi:predicted enzyme related to lactoylglutathione lyase
MKRIIASICLISVLTSCHTISKTSRNSDDIAQSGKSLAVADTTPRVTGIGGIFFYSDSPQKTKDWYGQNLGIVSDQYGSVFESRNANRPDEINYLVWSPFKKGNDYFVPSSKEFMINYRVQNIEALLDKLKKNGVSVLDSISTYDYGKFVHILDNEGTKIELWEPIDSELTKLGGETNK